MRDLTQLFEPVIESMGYELVGIEFQGGGGHGTLRVYIDREDGVSVDDCAAISHQVSGILDVEEPISQAYDLEISSPGIDRPLFKLEDFERFAGRMARIKLMAGIEGRRNFKGLLSGVAERGPGEAQLIRLEVDGEMFELPYADIARANLVGEI